MNKANETYKVENFNKNLIAFRKLRGWSQREFAKRSGLSQRMIVYYESQGGEPPAHVLIELASALKISVDKLLGIEEIEKLSPKSVRVWKRLLKVQDFPKKDKDLILGMIEKLSIANTK